ncbi:MAG: hypothetical protein U0992_14845 [Planctomycetaceae bacterium]
MVLYFAWLNYSWLDPRFVGAWRVTSPKWDSESIWVLHSDGKGMRLQRDSTGQWFQSGYDWHWSISRDGFLFENIPSKKSQLKSYVMSLGGILTSKGKLAPLRFVSNRREEILSVDETSIRLVVRQEGIWRPTELTLERLDEADVPVARP